MILDPATGPSPDEPGAGGRVQHSGAALLLSYSARLSLAAFVTILALWFVSQLWSLQCGVVASAGVACGAVNVSWEERTGLSGIVTGPLRTHSAWQWPTIWRFSSTTVPSNSSAGDYRHDLVVPLWPFVMAAGVAFGVSAGTLRYIVAAGSGRRPGRFRGTAGATTSTIVCCLVASLVYLGGTVVLIAAHAPARPEGGPLLSMPDDTPRICRNGLIPFHDYEVYSAGGAWQRLVAFGGSGELTPVLVVRFAGALALVLLLGAVLLPLVVIGLRGCLRRWQPLDVPSTWNIEADVRGGPAVEEMLRMTMRLLVPAAVLVTTYRALTSTFWHWNFPLTLGGMVGDMAVIWAMATCAAVLLAVWMRWTRLARVFVDDRAVCRCGYISGLAAECPECGQLRQERRGYYLRLRARHTAAIAGVFALGALVLVSINVYGVRAQWLGAVRGGWGPTVMQRLKPPEGAVYLRVPARSRLELAVGPTLYQVEIVSRTICVGPMVNLGGDRSFATSISGELAIVVRDRETDTTAVDAAPVLEQAIPIQLDRYGPVNQITSLSVGSLQLTTGIHIEYPGCVEVLVHSDMGFPVVPTGVHRIGPKDVSTDESLQIDAPRP